MLGSFKLLCQTGESQLRLLWIMEQNEEDGVGKDKIADVDSDCFEHSVVNCVVCLLL
jgi:hypothetical protein